MIWLGGFLKMTNHRWSPEIRFWLKRFLLLIISPFFAERCKKGLFFEANIDVFKKRVLSQVMSVNVRFLLCGEQFQITRNLRFPLQFVCFTSSTSFVTSALSCLICDTCAVYSWNLMQMVPGVFIQIVTRLFSWRIQSGQENWHWDIVYKFNTFFFWEFCTHE